MDTTFAQFAFASNRPASVASGARPQSAIHDERAQLEFSHQLLWLQALGTKLRPEDAGSGAMFATQSPAVGREGVSPTAPIREVPVDVDRWSLDAWAFWREGATSAPISQGRVPIYGASQIGANGQFRIAPSSGHDPRVYLRAYRALVTGGETEVAAGLSARPLGSVPLRFAAELRVTQNSFDRLEQTEVRPAVNVITELPPQRLPLGFRLEAYAGAGYVGGDAATPFVDGQASVTREVVSVDGPANSRARLSLGAAAWGGAQEDAGRIDVGPTARLDLTIGKVPARVSVDWREQVGGDAAPSSGVAATLSTRF
jgi:hypothetical protein